MKESSVNIAVLFLGLLVVSLGSVFFYSPTLEDAFITFRYSAHLAEGHGLGAWNVGDPPVEGYTSLVWTLLMSLASLSGVSLLTASKVLGWLSCLAIVIGLFRFDSLANPQSRDLAWNAPVRLLVLLVPLSLPMLWYSVSGMESTFYSAISLLFLGLALRYRDSAGWLDLLLAVLLILTRPEGLVLVVVTYLVLIRLAWTRPAQRNRLLTKLGLVALALLTLTGWRQMYFGYPLPNTYYAKADGGWEHLLLGLAYVRRAIGRYGYWVFVLPLVAMAWGHFRNRWDRRLTGLGTILTISIVGYVAMMIKTGGDNDTAFPYSRHFVHIYPLLVLLAMSALAGLRRFRYPIAIAGLVLVAFLINRQTISPTQVFAAGSDRTGAPSPGLLQHEPPLKMAAWMVSVFPKQTYLAVTLGGELPYYTNFRVLDMLGLSDVHIAHHGTFARGAVDTRSDGAYVIAQRPDLIETTLDPSLIIEGRPRVRYETWRGKMENELLDQPYFRDNYVFVANAPYEDFPRALFARRDFVDNLPNRNSLLTISASQTTLYRTIKE